MTTQTSTSSTAPAEGFWKLRHVLIGLAVLAALVMLMMRACGGDGQGDQVDAEQEKPRQAVVVQIPASRVPPVQQRAQQAVGEQDYGYAPQPGYQQQQNYGYAPPQQPMPLQQPPPAAATGNPWAVRQQPYSYGQPQSQQWGGAQPNRPQYAQPSTQPQYRPLEQQSIPAPTAQPQQVPQQTPVIVYRPSAPYDRRSGSSFGAQTYPYGYGGGYPGYPGAPGVPGGHLGYPGIGYPGYW